MSTKRGGQDISDGCNMLLRTSSWKGTNSRQEQQSPRTSDMASIIAHFQRPSYGGESEVHAHVEDDKLLLHVSYKPSMPSKAIWLADASREHFGGAKCKRSGNLETSFDNPS